MVLYTFTFLDSRREDKILWNAHCEGFLMCKEVPLTAEFALSVGEHKP
jgi:hypothetical protein